MISRCSRRLALLAMSIVAALAQVDTGTISGIVTDASGAIVPGASVTVIQQETNVRVTLGTNETGFYSSPGLRSGRYDIAVTKAGFQAQRKTGVELRVQDRLEINFSLTIGGTSTEVTVAAAAPLLESEPSSLGQGIDGTSIIEMPLNGRSFIQLATLSAGTLLSTRTQERDNFISNGARAVQNSYLLDGIDNKNRILGFDKNSAQIIQPVIDGIEEFKVQTATFSAEFGQAAGGVVNVTMRSGTNSYHGNVFEFLRNKKLDATPYFQPAGGQAAFIQNQFGATFGGRIIRDRTFFFGSWQSSREGNAAPQIASVPILSEHQGIFPVRVNDPTAGGAAFPNNTIPLNRWDPVAAKLVALYPLPTLPGTVNNYSYNPKEIVNTDTYSVKLDHHFGAKDYLFGRISQGWSHNILPTLLPDPANSQGFTDLIQRQVVFSESHTVAANKVNEFRVGYVYTLEAQDVNGPRLFDQYGIKGALDAPNIKGLPTFTLTGFSQLGTPTTLGTTPIPASGSGNRPVLKSGKVWQLLDNFSWTHDRHTIKFGIDFSRVTQFAKATNSARPGMTFNGTFTTSGLGDFLLGDVFSATTSEQQLLTIRQNVYDAYAQDDWKVSRKLTLNLGLRYELPTPFFEARDHQSNFVLDASPCYGQLVPVAQRGQCNAGLGRYLTRLDKNNFAPRVGLAYKATDKIVVRGGFGVFYGRDENYGISARLPSNPPWVSTATFTGTAAAPAFLLKDGYPLNALALTASGFNANTTVYTQPFNFPTSYVEQWNINVQHQFAGDFVAQAGYTGSEAHKLLYPINVNQAFPGAGAVNSRRPFQGVGNISQYAPLVNSTYNALVAKLERRFAKGLSLLASYTMGHSLDGGGNEHDTSDVTPQNVRNLSAEKGSSNFDVRQRIVLSGFYQLPFGKKGGLASYLIRDWQVSGGFSAQGGQPFTATLSTDPAATGAGTPRPIRNRDGNLPTDQRTITHWFDDKAFTVPTCACFGNSGRDILRGPGFMNLDVGVHRDFHFGERFRVQFRAESFNMMNHPNFGIPNSAIGNPAVGTITTTINPERQNQLALKFFF
jgi:hypothetical protein